MTPTPITRAMREAAEKATPGPWVVFPDDLDERAPGIEAPNVRTSIVVYGDPDDYEGVQGRTPEEARANAAHIALANPANVLALLDALEEAGKVLKPFAIPKEKGGGYNVTDIRAEDYMRATAALDRINTLSGEEA